MENHPDYPDTKKRPLVIGHKKVTLFPAYSAFTDETKPSECLSANWFSIEDARNILDKSILPKFEEALKLRFVKNLV